MQAQGAAQRGGVGTIPRRGGRWLEALLTVAAILVIVALMALMTRGMVAGYAPVHDDTGIMHASMVKDMVQMRQGAVKNTGIMHASMVKDMGSAIVHDDAGNVR